MLGNLLPYSGILLQILRFVAIHKSFLCEIWDRGIFGRGKSRQSAKVFSAKIGCFFSPIHESFIP